jgi:hypothetical protein
VSFTDETLSTTADAARRALLTCGLLESGPMIGAWAQQVLDEAAPHKGPDPIAQELAVWTVAAQLTPNADGCRVLIEDSVLHHYLDNADDDLAAQIIATLARRLTAGVLAPHLRRAAAL